MQQDIDRILISQAAIAERVGTMARQITADFATAINAEEPSEITIVPIMTGALVFTADLIRQIPIALRIGLLTVSSYPGKSISSQGPTVLRQQLGDVAGRRLLVVDDVLDSGRTLGAVLPMLKSLGAATVRSCVLLRKDRPEARATAVDYVGFDIPDVFIVGYGLDYDNYYRNLPDIVTLKPHALSR
ncbi:MAG TPA: phosphoribosyltransferase family protein [Tepidisphaeraceae bacterium]|jgi:hypoxanthine phosphoribosyltransferase|nr:phosphoribosyltransferase family protein [Tepidisphaeraceae bacterium]